MEHLGAKNLIPVAKGMEMTNIVPCSDLARGDREQKKPWQWQKYQIF
jgi:hypothetical protein